MPVELEGPECPAGLESVWEDFLALCGRRTHTGFGPAPLTYQDLDAWARMTGQLLPLESWRIRMLCQLDDAWLKSVRETTQETKPQGSE